jgi:hypothetical protein
MVLDQQRLINHVESIGPLPGPPLPGPPNPPQPWPEPGKPHVTKGKIGVGLE